MNLSSTIFSSGETPLTVSSIGADWRNILEVPGTALVNSITIVNEGDAAGFWRLWSSDADVSPSIRLPAHSSTTVPAPGFSGAVQVKAEARLLTGLFAFGIA
jgi:hypothetical protein